MDDKQLWTKVLTEVELSISKPNFNTWFKDTFILKKDGGTVHIGVPNAFAREWLSTKYHTFLLKNLRSLAEDIRGIEYVVSKSNPHKHKKDEESVHESVTNTLPLEEHYVNKEDNLNPRYTFDSFVIGPFNELAHAAAQAVIERPGIVYNPLFIYGNTGHGKTHLIQAIGNQIKKLYDKKNVYYVTSEKFTLDYINSVQVGKANNFKEKYRKYDVLIMDDIQFFTADHPLLRNSLDSLLSSEKGNAVLSVYQGTEAPGIFLQVTYLVECVAPRHLHIDRYLPVSPTTLWLDHAGEAIPAPSFSVGKLNSSPNTDDILGNSGIKRLVKKMLRSAEAQMFKVTEDLVTEAGIAAEKELQSEISRLQNLARLNPSVDQSEIKNLQTHQTEIEEALAETRFRLDSLHLVVCEN